VTPVPRQAAPAAPVREVDAEQLFLGSNVVHIMHGGACYTLRRTSQHKLILTK
jgi:hemin uptake protein HemP